MDVTELWLLCIVMFSLIVQSDYIFGVNQSERLAEGRMVRTWKNGNDGGGGSHGIKDEINWWLNDKGQYFSSLDVSKG